MSEIEDAAASCFEQNLAALERGDFPPGGPAHKSAFWIEDAGEIRLNRNLQEIPRCFSAWDELQAIPQPKEV